MTRERIEDFREIVLPFVKKRLLETNYENLGKSDAEEFEKDFNEILDMAIKALEQEPTTKNDLGVDCISRAYLCNRIYGIDHDEDYECDEFGGSRITYHTCDWDEVLREIADAPSVTPQEPKTGHWIFVGEENEEETRNGNFRYICSKCGYSDVHAKSTEVPYCWHCGAKMAEQEET